MLAIKLNKRILRERVCADVCTPSRGGKLTEFDVFLFWELVVNSSRLEMTWTQQKIQLNKKLMSSVLSPMMESGEAPPSPGESRG